MKKLNRLSSILFLGLAAMMFSCFEDAGTDIILEGSFVEIQEATTSGGLDLSKSYNRLNNGIATRDSIRVNLVGPQRSSAVNVNFQIDASSTAVAGVHYNMITTGTSVTIPANSSFGYIYFEILADNIEPGEVWRLKFNLTGTDDTNVKLSENYKSFTRSIRILCPFDRANFLGAFNCDEPGYKVYTVNFSADGTDPNTIVSDNFWDVGAVVKYTFNPASNTLVIQTTSFTANIGFGPESLTVSANGTATYDACEYSFIVPYKVVRDVNGSTVETNTHTFTKQ